MEWYRRYHGTCTNPKLHRLAVSLGMRRFVVIPVWDAVLEEASQASPRGSVEHVTAELIASLIDMPVARARRIWEAMKASQLIDGNTVAGWSARQFESDNSTPRVQKHRQSLNEKRIEKRSQIENFENDNPLKNNNTDAGCNVSETHHRQSTENQSQSPITAAEYNTPTGARDPNLPAAAAGDLRSDFDDEDPTPRKPEQPPPDPDPLHIDPGVIDLFVPRYEVRGVPRKAVETELRALAAQAGTGAMVTQALCQAMRRGSPDPIAYATATINGRLRDMQAARDRATAPAEDDSLKAFRELLEEYGDEPVQSRGRDEGTAAPVGGFRQIQFEPERQDADRDLRGQARVIPFEHRAAGCG